MAKTQKLVSRRNTKRVRDLVVYAAGKKFSTKGRRVREVTFTGGAWVVTVYTPSHDLWFNVIDAEPGVAGTGLDFKHHRIYR